MELNNALALLLIAAVFCCMPALGVDKYVGGSPEITAYISGVNEFSPGQDATITVIIQNSGTNTAKFTSQGTLADDDLATTAKLVTVGLDSGTAPIVIKTDPQSLGDIKSPQKTTATFTAKITSDATLGEYTLPLTVKYKYLSNYLADQATSDTIQYHYTPVTQTIPLTIRIKPEVRIDVLDAVTSNLVVGTEGYVNLTIRNIGYEDGKQATVKLLRSGTSAVIPTDNNVYIGEFPRNGIVTCLYKVAISADAQAQTYPIDVAVTYTNAEGDTVTSTTDTIGVPVADKLRFNVTSPPAGVTQGETRVITVEYQNLGTITANHAQARLSVVEPLSSSDSTAYLGDIPPGGKATAQYSITAASGAEPASYALDTEVRYRDALDNSQISDTFK
ncbi:MAG: S-layer protein, partial [Methanoregula sp.]